MKENENSLTVPFRDKDAWDITAINRLFQILCLDGIANDTIVLINFTDDQNALKDIAKFTIKDGEVVQQ